MAPQQLTRAWIGNEDDKILANTATDPQRAVGSAHGTVDGAVTGDELCRNFADSRLLQLERCALNLLYWRLQGQDCPCHGADAENERCQEAWQRV